MLSTLRHVNGEHYRNDVRCVLRKSYEDLTWLDTPVTLVNNARRPRAPADRLYVRRVRISAVARNPMENRAREKARLPRLRDP